MKKNTKINKKIYTEKTETLVFCKDKILIFKEMITRTILFVQRYKTMDIITASEMNICILNLETLYKQLNILESNLKHLKEKKNNYDEIINSIQKINNELSSIFRNYGSDSIESLLSVSMGNNFIQVLQKDDKRGIFKTINSFIHPISYVVLPWKKNNPEPTGKKINIKNKIIEDHVIVESQQNFECFDLSRTSKGFQKKIFGIKVALHDKEDKKTIIIYGVVDDILTECVNDTYILNKLNDVIKNKPDTHDFQGKEFEIYSKILTIKELLIYDKTELYQRFIGYLNQTNLIKQKPISQNIKEFVGGTLFDQRKTLIQLLIKYDDPEFQYLAYLLYDLLSNDNNSSIDTVEQTVLFDSLPWNIKKLFREAMKITINYTKTLSNFDQSKIPLEQQICLMKVSDNVKEKAMIKLKEIKAKAEDSGSKARHYLDGLLKIPFGIYKTEPILNNINIIRDDFKKCIDIIKSNDIEMDEELLKCVNITSIEISKHFYNIKTKILYDIQNKQFKNIINFYYTGKRKKLISNVCMIKAIVKQHELENIDKICHSGKKNQFMKDNIINFINKYKEETTIIDALNVNLNTNPKTNNNCNISELKKVISNIETNWDDMNKTITNIKTTLDNAIHGHDKAKRHLQRIIGQWITGKNNGYCLGFEGPPGIGKTSLAKKGLSNCLLDVDGKPRPFAMIQIGGGSNSSTLAGHNFTYVGSQWGRIVDILIEQKCMNPIIFIDEIDKISQSENGKEITGVLTHIVDETQNDCFQDKFFNGIDVDLSKILFIFSYNDPSKVDPILLDRFHRIKFDNISLQDKLIICKKYILPELYAKFNIPDCIDFTDDIIEFIIEMYTYESGVRKLKEIIYEIIGEINLEIINNINNKMSFPIKLTEANISDKYLKTRTKVLFTKIHSGNKIGLISGLWANSYGKGGIIQIETLFFPTNNFLELKLTGSLGDVMKESSEVAKDVAWKLTSPYAQKNLTDKVGKINKGIRIHFPEGATPKNGPSAGTAITIAIYSLLNSKKIKNNIAITGEINLQGNVTAIGGLDLKILGGIKAGVKHFIFPGENKTDFDTFMEKYKNNNIINDISFTMVDTIEEVLKIVFVSE